MTEEKGVWRTISGRRVFIRDGQVLSDAMKECGKFGTSDAEKQRKINSVDIDFTRDNVLPELNKEDLEELGVENKPVLLKKNIIDKNFASHPDVKQEEYSYIVGQSLYNHDLVAPGHEEKPYFNFVARVGDDKNTVVLLQIDNTNTGYMEIVNLHWARNESRNLIERKGEKIKKKNK